MGIMKKKKQGILEIEMCASLSVSFPKMPCEFLHSANIPCKYSRQIQGDLDIIRQLPSSPL